MNAVHLIIEDIGVGAHYPFIWGYVMEILAKCLHSWYCSRFSHYCRFSHTIYLKKSEIYSCCSLSIAIYLSYTNKSKEKVWPKLKPVSESKISKNYYQCNIDEANNTFSTTLLNSTQVQQKLKLY
jgi:hypothetical protein